MKFSIKTKFVLGMIFLFVIILVLSVFSTYYINRLSKKTSAILKENYISVAYARDMSEGLMNIGQEIANCFLLSRKADSAYIDKELSLIYNSLNLEKNNITETGEGKLVADIESNINIYRDSVRLFIKHPHAVSKAISLEEKSGIIFGQLTQLSRLNGTAIEVKTDDAKISSKTALTQMTILGTLSFLIALSFIYSFASYFNDRFFQLYNGIKEIVSSNYNQRLFFEGKDEFYEISLVFNEMATRLNENKMKMSLTLQEDFEKSANSKSLIELKGALLRIKNLEKQTADLISRIENT